MHLCSQVSQLYTRTKVVTNLLTSLDRTRTGNDLTEAVQDLFSQIGPCWTKVRFDKKNIPAAFVQYQVRSSSNRRSVTRRLLTQFFRRTRKPLQLMLSSMVPASLDVPAALSMPEHLVSFSRRLLDT